MKKEDSGMYCPKCGEENDNEAKFCKRCGSPLKRESPTISIKEDVDSSEKEEKSVSQSKERKKEKSKQTTFFVFSVLSLLFFIVCLGLLFSNYLTIRLSGSGVSRVFTYRLGPIDLLINIWNGVKGINKEDSLSAQINATRTIVDASTVFAITLLGFVGLASLAIIGLYKETKSLIEKKSVKTDFILFLFLLSTIFMISLLRGAFTNSLSYSYGVKASIGEGPLAILLLGVPLLFAKTFCRLLFEYRKEERLFFAGRACMALSLVVALSLASQFKNSLAYIDATFNNFGIGSLFDYRMSRLVGLASEDMSITTINGLIGTLISFLLVRYAFAFLIFACVILFIKNLWNGEGSRNLIICPSLMIGVSVLLTICLPLENTILSNIVTGLGTSSETIQIGSALPSLIGESLLLLGIGIASYLLWKNVSKEEQPKA